VVIRSGLTVHARYIVFSYKDL